MATNVREPRAEKVAVVDEVLARFEASSAAILTEYRGLSVADLQELRRALAGAGSEYKVYKNTLVRRAVAANGLGVLEPLLEGPTAIAFVESDISAVAKVLRDFARTNPNLVIKGGLLGTNLLDARSTTALAELPPRETLLAQLAGGLAAPLQGFAALLAALPSKFAYGLSALIATKPAEPVAEQAPVVEEAPVVEASAPAESEAEVTAEAEESDVTSDAVSEEPAAETVEAATDEAPAESADESN